MGRRRTLPPPATRSDPMLSTAIYPRHPVCPAAPLRRAQPLRLLVAALLVLAGSPPAAALEQRMVNPLGMEFVLIPAGRFTMGSPTTETGRSASERPHEVVISHPFYLQTTEVTVAQWRAVMGRRLIARKRGADDMPVVKVSWFDTQKFIRSLNQRTGQHYRLPTEAEWEYASRAGSTTAYSWGDRVDCRQAMFANHPLGYDACVDENRRWGLRPDHPAPVKHYPPNAWGLYDMHGNVWEWCIDLFDRYDGDTVVDPCNTEDGRNRVRRGGSWFGPASHMRSANRAFGHPMSRLQNTGFRLALDPPDTPREGK